MDPKAPWIKRLFSSGHVKQEENEDDLPESADALRAKLQSQEEELAVLRAGKKTNFWEDQVKGLAVVGYVFLAVFIGFIVWAFLE